MTAAAAETAAAAAATATHVYEEQDLLMCLRHALNNATVADTVTITELEATAAAKRNRQTRRTGFATDVLHETAERLFGAELRTWLHTASQRPTDWSACICRGAVVYSANHYFAVCCYRMAP